MVLNGVKHRVIPRLESETEEALREAQTDGYKWRRRWARVTGKPVPPSYYQLVDHVLLFGCAPGLLPTTEEYDEYRGQFSPGEVVHYTR